MFKYFMIYHDRHKSTISVELAANCRKQFRPGYYPRSCPKMRQTLRCLVLSPVMWSSLTQSLPNMWSWRSIWNEKSQISGDDRLNIKHLKHVARHIDRVLSLLITFCIRRSYLPLSQMKTVVIPLVKNRAGLTNNSLAKDLDIILDVHLNCPI